MGPERIIPSVSAAMDSDEYRAFVGE